MTKRVLGLAICAAALLAASPAVFASSCSVEDLAWMRGNWHIDTAERQTEERWVPGYGGMLMGSSWTMAKGKPAFVEAMVIAEGDKGVEMRLRHFAGNLSRAWEDKEVPMVFVAGTCEGTSAIFEGQGKQLGERLTYRRDGDKLLVIGDFIHDGKPSRVEFNFFRAGE